MSSSPPPPFDDATLRGRLGEAIADLAHDLRTPLTAVVGFADLLLDEVGGPMTAEQKDFARTIRASADQLMVMLVTLIDFAKAESGKLHVNCAPLDVVLPLAEAVDWARIAAEKKGVTIDLRYPREIFGVGDRMRVRQVAQILLGNAVKFSPSGGRVVAEVVPGAAGTVNLGVTDSGPGIAADRLPTLFLPFHPPSPAGKHSGTGVALALARRVAEEMGGGLSVQNEPGRGATFVLSLRAAAGGR